MSKNQVFVPFYFASLHNQSHQFSACSSCFRLSPPCLLKELGLKARLKHVLRLHQKQMILRAKMHGHCTQSKSKALCLDTFCSLFWSWPASKSSHQVCPKVASYRSNVSLLHTIVELGPDSKVFELLIYITFRILIQTHFTAYEVTLPNISVVRLVIDSTRDKNT